MFEPYRDADASLLIRTDFSDDSAWQALREVVSAPTLADGFAAFFSFVDDHAIGGLPVNELARHAHADLGVGTIFVADASAMAAPDYPVLCVETAGDPPQSFRTIAAEIWGPENNLRLANMDFAEFAGAVAKDGVFRGF